ncbi:MAG: polysaccharide deacetylase family protein [Clostridiales bacterium]|jgi:polysaccharide deacetylase family sporulation protein PdaB|nr:polysaccharide deacetylase family protein [Clostridiales bacterium]
MLKKWIGSIPLHQKKAAIWLVALVLVAIAAFNARPAVEMVFKTITYVEAARKLPIYSVETQEKRVAISFDAAWGADDTDKLLSILKDHDTLATFFLCGYWVDKYPEEVKKIYEAGHDIGNHSKTHAHGGELSFSQNVEEIMGAHEKIKKLLGIDMNLYRPPYGEYNNTVIQAAQDNNYFPIQWDVDSHDWMNKGVDYEINRVLNNKNLRNGSIILFHNDAKDTPIALPVILDGLKERGYTVGPVSALIYKEGYHLDNTGRQFLDSSTASK